MPPRPPSIAPVLVGAFTGDRMTDEPEFDYEAWLEERRIADENRMRRLFGECPLCGSLLATTGECMNTECDYMLLDDGRMAGWKPPTADTP